jgi:hypothetical protein
MVPEVRPGICQERDGCNDAENNYARSVCGGFWRVNHDVIEAAAAKCECKSLTESDPRDGKRRFC